MTKPKRGPKEASRSRPSICVGCGGAAAGYNYEAPSCYSCKTFFRRTIVDEKVLLACMKNGFCAREGATSQCRACRFLRCVRGGMNPRMIGYLTNPDENPVVKSFYVKMEVDDDQPCTSSAHLCPYVQKRRQHGVAREGYDYTEEIPDDPEDMKFVPNPPLFESKLEKNMQTLLVLEDAHRQLRNSAYLPKLTPKSTIDDFAFTPSKLGEKFDIMCDHGNFPILIQLFPEELYIKHRISIDFTQVDFDNRKIWLYQDNVYAMEFVKALPFYSLLEDSSKKVLLASALTCSNITSAYFSYIHKSDRSCYPDGSVMSWSRELQEEAPDSSRFHTALITAMKEMKIDRREYVLLKLIVVCNPVLAGLSAHDVTLLQNERERCTKTLFSYVLARHGVNEGPAIFAKLLAIVELVNVLTSWQKSQRILMMAMGLHKHRSPFCEDIFHSS